MNKDIVNSSEIYSPKNNYISLSTIMISVDGIKRTWPELMNHLGLSRIPTEKDLVNKGIKINKNIVFIMLNPGNAAVLTNKNNTIGDNCQSNSTTDKTLFKTLFEYAELPKNTGFLLTDIYKIEKETEKQVTVWADSDSNNIISDDKIDKMNFDILEKQLIDLNPNETEEILIVPFGLKADKAVDKFIEYIDNPRYVRTGKYEDSFIHPSPSANGSAGKSDINRKSRAQKLMDNFIKPFI